MNPLTFGNYHTHTYRCGHASGDVADYAREARKAGLSELGMTDHVPLPDSWMGDIRMPLSELDAYTLAIEKASTPSFKVLKGMECEAVPRYYGFYREELLLKRSYDYLIGSVHWYECRGEWTHAVDVSSPSHLRAYTDTLVSAMRERLFSFFAHPDHFMAGWKAWDREAKACSRDILEAAAETGAVLEINGNGFRKSLVEGQDGPRIPYPFPRFWELAAEYGVKIISNSDAHRPEDAAASIDRCQALARSFGLESLASPPPIV